MLVFLDANILFSAAYKADSKLLQIWNIPDVRCLTSEYAREEARRHLHDVQWERLEEVLQYTKIVANGSLEILPDNIVLREKDVPILQAALSADADYLLTGDYRDFDIFFGTMIKNTTILPPAAFLKKVRNR